MAEWLKALVLKVLDGATNPANTVLPLMSDISVFFFWAVLMADIVQLWSNLNWRSGSNS
jgi:hypothetical protein